MQILISLIQIILASNVYCTAEHLVTHNTWMTGHPDLSTGSAVFYAPGVMEATAEYRHVNGGKPLDGYVDGVSLMSPSDLGATVWIRYNGVWEGPFLSVDTAQQNHMCQAVQTRGEVVEVGYRTAQRWGMTDWPTVHEWKVDVEVSLVSPECMSNACECLHTCSIEKVHYPTWWSNQAELLP